MRRTRQRGRFTTVHQLEELGKTMGVCLTFLCTWDITPGEPMVMYYPDGSGYPGSGPSLELVSLQVTDASGETWEFRRTERLGWFLWLDKVVLNWPDWQAIEDEAYEQLNNYFEESPR